MRTLKHDGYRFLVSPDGKKANWIHSLDTVTHAGWHDCTNMTGAQVRDFVDELLAGQQAAVAGA